MEYQESLEPGTLVGQLPDPVQHQVYDLLADGVVAASVIVGRIFFARDQLLRVEELSVRAGSHFVCNDRTRRFSGCSGTELGNYRVVLFVHSINPRTVIENIHPLIELQKAGHASRLRHDTVVGIILNLKPMISRGYRKLILNEILESELGQREFKFFLKRYQV